MAGYSRRELEDFVSGRSDIVGSIETLKRRLDEPKFAHKRDDYSAKLGQLEQLESLSADISAKLASLTEEPADDGNQDQ